MPRSTVADKKFSMMNFMTLSAGEAIYVPADAPHAYLYGDIVECMARSNNVLNTGFCPRADRDSIELFTSALTFSPHSAEETRLLSKKSDKGKMGKTIVYAPPMSEFNMLATHLEENDKEIISPIAGPTVLFITRGSGTMRAGDKTWKIREGFVFFVGQGTELTYETEKSTEIYSAYAE